MHDFEKLRQRAKEFAVEVNCLADSLPRRQSCEVLSKQIIRTASSIGANHRAACRSQSRAEFIAKMHVVQEEADETEYWLELLYGTGAIADTDYRKLYDEARELTAICTALEKTARLNRGQRSKE